MPRTFVPGNYTVMGSLPQEFPNVTGSGGVSTNVTDLARFGESDFGRGGLDKSGGTSQFVAQLYVVPEHNLTAAMAVTQDFKGDVPTVLRGIVSKVLRTQGIETARPAPAPPALTPQPLPPGFEQEYAGYYGFYVGMLQVTVNGDQSITLMQRHGDAFFPMGESLRYDGTAFARSSGERLFRFVEAEGLLKILPGELTFTVPEKGRVFAYDQTGVKVYDSMVQGATVSQVPDTGYIRFTGPPGVQFTVSVSPPPA